MKFRIVQDGNGNIHIEVKKHLFREWEYAYSASNIEDAENTIKRNINRLNESKIYDKNRQIKKILKIFKC